MKKFTLLAVTVLLAVSTQAQMTFNFTYSGLAFGNSATANGTVTFAPGWPPNPGSVPSAPLSPGITALSVTVLGTAGGVGDGTFGMASFSTWYWLTTSALNLSTELVGQPDGSGTWGIDSGGFTLYTASIDSAPDVVGAFALGANGGSGESMGLTSFAPVPVPEPHESALMVGVSLLGLAAWRRRRRA